MGYAADFGPFPEEKVMRIIQNKISRNSIGTWWIVWLACLLVFTASIAVAQTDRSVPHLETARQLVRDLQHHARINEYGSQPTFLRWNHPTREARTVCATFITHLFEHTYGWKEEDIQQWIGSNGADASEWQEAIVHENGFRHLKTVDEVHPGDILAIKYNDGSKDTGHIMVVDEEPEHITASSPIEPETKQYRVEVIDSSASGHGPTDTRHKPDGGFTGGIGQGTIRLYVDEGRILSGMHGVRRRSPSIIKAPHGI